MKHSNTRAEGKNGNVQKLAAAEVLESHVAESLKLVVGVDVKVSANGLKIAKTALKGGEDSIRVPRRYKVR